MILIVLVGQECLTLQFFVLSIQGRAGGSLHSSLSLVARAVRQHSARAAQSLTIPATDPDKHSVFICCLSLAALRLVAVLAACVPGFDRVF